jgi:hypothetical protein
MFGHRPDGQAIDPASLCVHAPSVVEIRIPAELAAGCEFVATGSLAKAAGVRKASVQLQVLATKPTGRFVRACCKLCPQVAIRDGYVDRQ